MAKKYKKRVYTKVKDKLPKIKKIKQKAVGGPKQMIGNCEVTQLKQAPLTKQMFLIMERDQINQMFRFAGWSVKEYDGWLVAIKRRADNNVMATIKLENV